MNDVKISLCPSCTACPEVEVIRAGGEVRIDEAGNLTVLNKEAWNMLIDLMRDQL